MEISASLHPPFRTRYCYLFNYRLGSWLAFKYLATDGTFFNYRLPQHFCQVVFLFDQTRLEVIVSRFVSFYFAFILLSDKNRNSGNVGLFDGVASVELSFGRNRLHLQRFAWFFRNDYRATRCLEQVDWRKPRQRPVFVMDDCSSKTPSTVVHQRQNKVFLPRRHEVAHADYPSSSIVPIRSRAKEMDEV